MKDAGEPVGFLELLEGEEEVHVLYWSLWKTGERRRCTFLSFTGASGRLEFLEMEAV